MIRPPWSPSSLLQTPLGIKPMINHPVLLCLSCGSIRDGWIHNTLTTLSSWWKGQYWSKVFIVHSSGWSCDLSVISISRWNIFVNWTSCGKKWQASFSFSSRRVRRERRGWRRSSRLMRRFTWRKAMFRETSIRWLASMFLLTILGRSKLSFYLTIFLCLVRQLWRSSIWSGSAVWSQLWGRERPPSRNWALSSAAKTPINPNYMPVWMYPEVGSVWIKITEDWKHGSNIKPQSEVVLRPTLSPSCERDRQKQDRPGSRCIPNTSEEHFPHKENPSFDLGAYWLQVLKETVGHIIRNVCICNLPEADSL